MNDNEPMEKGKIEFDDPNFRPRKKYIRLPISGDGERVARLESDLSALTAERDRLRLALDVLEKCAEHYGDKDRWFCDERSFYWPNGRDVYRGDKDGITFGYDEARNRLSEARAILEGKE